MIVVQIYKLLMIEGVFWFVMSLLEWSRRNFNLQETAESRREIKNSWETLMKKWIVLQNWFVAYMSDRAMTWIISLNEKFAKYKYISFAVWILFIIDVTVIWPLYYQIKTYLLEILEIVVFIWNIDIYLCYRFDDYWAL